MDNKQKKSLSVVIAIVVGLIVAVIIGCVILIQDIMFPYDTDNYKDVSKVCKDVFEFELEKDNLEDIQEAYAHLEYDIVDYAAGIRNVGNMFIGVEWVEFSKSKEAQGFYEYIVKVFKEDMQKLDSDGSCRIAKRKTELIYEFEGIYNKTIIINSGNCVMCIVASGQEKKLDDITDNFLDELD